VDSAFGTGALKVTPAHDPNDFEISKRHNISKVNILTQDGKLNKNVPLQYQGLSVRDARFKIETELMEKGFLQDVKKHRQQVGHCYRSGKVVEPYLSTQWFIRMKPLAEKALNALESGDLRFYPKKWENTYKYWLSNIRDWCISRQLVWGHRIPVWYNVDTSELIVSDTDPSLDE
ncbi:valyl-tRNA synthetase, partial [Borreliella bissettiae]